MIIRSYRTGYFQRDFTYPLSFYCANFTLPFRNIIIIADRYQLYTYLIAIISWILTEIARVFYLVFKGKKKSLLYPLHHNGCALSPDVSLDKSSVILEFRLYTRDSQGPK